MLRDVEGVKGVAQRHKHAAMLRVLLGNAEPEHVAVEALGVLLVRNPEEDVADTARSIIATLLLWLASSGRCYPRANGGRKRPADQRPSSERPGWSSGRRPSGQWYLRSASAIGRSLIEARRRCITPSAANSQFSLP